METIHQRLKRLRVAKKLSMSGLARLLNLKYQAIQAWGDGRAAPTRKRLQAVAEALGVTPQELAHGAPQARQSNPGADPRINEIAHLFEWLTEAQKATLMGSIRTMATHNKSVTKELGNHRPASKPKTREKIVS